MNLNVTVNVNDLIRHLSSILILPVTVTLVVPALLASRSAPWLPAGSALGIVCIGAGLLVLALGLVLIVRTIHEFAARGRGTLAPWDPPTRLVVHGIYRYVRNPMISGVVLVVLGEALVFRRTVLLGWAAVVLLINAIYIPLSEERGLERRFGEDYREYKRHVPRWIPRRTPWQQPDAADASS